jgi:hypothetical protein
VNHEIKFRVWDKEEGMWLDITRVGFMPIGDGKGNELWYVQAIDENEKEIDPPYFPEQGEIDIVWYTGFNDVKGVEIYKGDIVLLEAYDSFTPYEVTQNDFNLVYELDSHLGGGKLHDIYHHCRVIGNIYENPELMEEGE